MYTQKPFEFELGTVIFILLELSLNNVYYEDAEKYNKAYGIVL